MRRTNAKRVRHGLALLALVLALASGMPLLMPHSVAAGIGYVYTVLEGPPGSTAFGPIAINNNGVLIGCNTSDSFFCSQHFLFSEGTYTAVTGLGIAAHLTGLNNNGSMVGYNYSGIPGPSGFVYSGGTYTDLSLFIPGAINDNGVIAGHVYSSSWGSLITVYDNGTYTAVAPPGWYDAGANGISNGGAVVGYGRKTSVSTATENFLFSGGTYSTLEPPPGWTSIGSLTGINDGGAISGWGYHGSTLTSFVYYNGGYTTVNPAGWTEVTVSDINNSGVVVGTGRDSGGVTRGFIATPTTVGLAATPLNQYLPGGGTVIPVGGSVSGGPVLVKAIVTDAEAMGQAKLQLELQPVSDNGGRFSGTVTRESPFVPSGGVAQILVSGLRGTGYHWRVRAANAAGDTSAWVEFGDNSETAVDFTVTALPDKIGVFRASKGTFYLDANGDGRLDSSERHFQFGQAGDVPFVGDWAGTGSVKAGVFRPSTGMIYLDWNGNDRWDDGWMGCATDRCLQIGMDEDVPVVGDWSGNGTSKVGVFRPADGGWYLDANGNGVWEGCAVDRCLQFGLSGDMPLVGDWTGSGTWKVGTFRSNDGMFFLDENGNGIWDGCNIDRCLSFGMSGDTPLLGDWDGGGRIKVGTVRPSEAVVYLDYNGNGMWDGCIIDRCLQFGLPGDILLVGDWDGTGSTKLGAFRPSNATFYLDVNGNGIWEGCGIDQCFQVGLSGDTPLVGKW
jgi:hypothetical protein